MSDEEESKESMSEGFSASEDEWKPTKGARGGESSDDEDDSDFEESSPIANLGGNTALEKKRGEPKPRSAVKQTASKKRSGLSLRAKLYNKYRPLPKTVVSPPGKNSPSASTSRINPKNAKTPNESNRRHRDDDDEEDDDEVSSEGSIDDYLVNPDELDIQSSFFNVEVREPSSKASVSPVPDFDCNAGLGNLSDSASEDAENNESGNFPKKETKAFDFRNLLENANSLERVKEKIAKHNADEAHKRTGTPSKSLDAKINSMDVYSLLALGEKQHRSHNDGEDEDDEEEEETALVSIGNKEHREKVVSRLSKTKSTRVKRHTKTRPTSTVVAGGDTDDSEFEEVADTSENADTTSASNISHDGNLEIHIELPSRHRDKKTRTQQDLEMALKRKFNRDRKERQLLLHKTSLLCHFGRTYFYNRLLNDTTLMQKALKLLPSKNAYPPERGTEIKYYQSLVTWFKTAIKLNSQNLYPDMKMSKSKALAHSQLMRQIEQKEANSKQDMIFIFIILLRGMGLQCRLINNMQPLPLKPPQSDLISIKLKQEDEDHSKSTKAKETNANKRDSDGKDGSESSSSLKTKQQSREMKVKEKQSKSLETIMKSASGKINAKHSHENNAKTASLKNSSKCKESTSKNIATAVEFSEKNNVEKSSSKAVKSNKSEYNLKQETDSNIVEKTLSNLTEKSNKLGLRKTITRASSAVKRSASSENEVIANREQTQNVENIKEDAYSSEADYLGNSQKENFSNTSNNKPSLARLKRSTVMDDSVPAKKRAAIETKVRESNKLENSNLSKSKNDESICTHKENSLNTKTKPAMARLKRSKAVDDKVPTKQKNIIKAGPILVPTIVVKGGKEIISNTSDEAPTTSTMSRVTRSRSKSPQIHISTEFLKTNIYKERFPGIIKQNTNVKNRPRPNKSPLGKVKISADFLTTGDTKAENKRVLRTRQKPNTKDAVEPTTIPDLNAKTLQIPQMDGANDEIATTSKKAHTKETKRKKIVKQKLAQDSEDDFEPLPIKKPKKAPSLPKKDRRVLSTDDEETSSPERKQQKQTASDMWIEVWSDVEEQWVCMDIFKGKIHCVDTIRKSASSNLAYVFAFQNDLSIKDVTARYSPHWTTVVRKSRIDKSWLDTAIYRYRGHRTKRDIKEDQELRRIHEEKPMPTAIGDYKNHPFYALERHLLKFEAIYPPEAPSLGFIRAEAVYSRDCVHTLHSREIWLKQARVVKLGEKPYKIVKARPKWDRITQTVIKDQPLEIFGYWQTQDYDPPTAENGVVPRNAYGNVELFKPTMLPKKCVHIRLSGLNRVCKKLGIDCANAVVGFDFHQGSCHPTYDGFVVCEEFQDQVTAAWYQDQEEQERKGREKYEARVYGNWKKLIRGLLIRERLKLKYDF